MKKIDSFFKKFLAFSLLALVSKAFSISVDFYATLSEKGDASMISMTSDLYFTQMQTISGYTVQDKRNTKYDAQNASDTNICFYAEINETDSGEWSCKLNAIKADQNKSLSITKVYSSYYLILMDAKDTIESLLENLLSSDSTLPQSAQGSASSNLESLSGNWSGGETIDKIVILRGGRGFVIFKNGASMNISISISGTNVTVTQQGKSNASFYPWLSREAALKSAPSAEATVWNFTLVDNNTLKGTENTLVENSSSPTGASRGKKNALWSRSK